MAQPLLEVRNLKRVVAQRTILDNVSFSLSHGDILFVRGPSGVGKSLLLRAVACLDVFQGGMLLLDGQPPEELSQPAWRVRISYLPQGRTSHKGTPAELYFQAQQFAAQKGRQRGDLPALVHELGLEQAVLNQPWAELSGGQAQRVSLAIAIALGPWVLLLDEPTSACDPVSTRRVESVLRSCGAAVVWVTHDAGQPARVGGRVLELPLGVVSPLMQPLPLPPPGSPELAGLPPAEGDGDLLEGEGSLPVSP